MNKIRKVCKDILHKDFDFKNAFNHSSFANKNKVESNEKLEFLGDSVINFYVTNWLFKQNGNEGELSKTRAKMVSTSSFAKICDGLELIKDLRIIGEVSAKIKANLFEAVIAEIFLQLKSKDDIFNLIKYLIIDDFNAKDFEDSKSVLQEILQENKIHNIVYKTEKLNEKFVARLTNNGKLLAIGEGTTKQGAEKDAARIAAQKLKKEGH